MPFEKGNEHGKKSTRQGKQNKSTKEVRQCFQNLISDNIEQMQSDLDSLTPKARLDVIIKLSQYVLPRLEAVNLSATELPEEIKFIFDHDNNSLKEKYGI